MKSEDALIAELYAAEVAFQLGKIATAQHRISCALASPQRAAVVAHLKTLGISEGAASAFVAEPLTHDQMQKITTLLEAIAGWRPHLARQVAALASA